jgi:hypothetical protein
MKEEIDRLIVARMGVIAPSFGARVSLKRKKLTGRACTSHAGSGARRPPAVNET